MEDKLKFWTGSLPRESRELTCLGFCEWVQNGIDVYISHWKFQVKPHSSPWFSAAGAAAIVQTYQFFRLKQQYKSCESKVKLRQASCKIISLQTSVSEAAKLAVNKIKVFIKSQKLGSPDFRTSTRTSIQQLGGVVFYIWHSKIVS